jgi:hypothetical protein
MMKKLVFILFVSIVSQSCVEKKKEPINIDYLGDYIGTFTDMNAIEGGIELSLFQSGNGQTGGTILIKKKGEDVLSGIVYANGSENGFNGNLVPSVVEYQAVEKDDEEGRRPFDTYSCSWSFYGRFFNDGILTVRGKAVPTNCSESNILEFSLEKKINSQISSADVNSFG